MSPYTLRLPTGWAHEVISARPQPPKDFFFPPIPGNVATNLSIYAQPAPRDHMSPVKLAAVNMAAMRSLGGRNVRILKRRLTIAGKRVPIVQADFGTEQNAWTLWQITFESHGYIWVITISWDHRLQRMAPQMTAIVQTFAYSHASR